MSSLLTESWTWGKNEADAPYGVQILLWALNGSDSLKDCSAVACSQEGLGPIVRTLRREQDGPNPKTKLVLGSYC